MKRGFTLVELSIVLVIIGLLIGGILTAQSMIKTAKITGFISDIQQYDMAVSNFGAKFISLPGDTALTAGGNGNGKIQSTSYNYTGEIGKFWSDLSMTGFLTPSGAAYPARSYSTDQLVAGDVPITRLGDNIGCVAIYSADLETSYGINYNFYLCFGTNSGGYVDYNAVDSTLILSNDALAIETKLGDDKLAHSGKVFGKMGHRDFTDQGTINSCFDIVTNKYYTQPTNPAYGKGCEMGIKMLGQVGQ